MPKIKSKQLNPHFTGSFDVSGSLAVDGQLIARQIEADTKALIVSGAMDIAKSAVASASVAIENLLSSKEYENGKKGVFFDGFKEIPILKLSKPL